MMNTKLFPSMVIQMTQIGEESGSLDGMLSKIAEFYEREVDDAVRRALEPARADHHRVPRRCHRRPRSLDVPADLQARRSRLTPLSMDPVLATVVAAAGRACVGSFLNVVIHRLPKMLERGWEAQCAELRGETLAPAEAYNLVVPRSACPKCGAPITALQNIPVVSWIAFGGSCAECKAPISARYPHGRDPRSVCWPPPRSGSSAPPRKGSRVRAPLVAPRAHHDRLRHAAPAGRHHAAAACGAG
jgi:hypothetical protein